MASGASGGRSQSLSVNALVEIDPIIMTHKESLDERLSFFAIGYPVASQNCSLIVLAALRNCPSLAR